MHSTARCLACGTMCCEVKTQTAIPSRDKKNPKRDTKSPKRDTSPKEGLEE